VQKYQISNVKLLELSSTKGEFVRGEEGIEMQNNNYLLFGKYLE